MYCILCFNENLKFNALVKEHTKISDIKFSLKKPMLTEARNKVTNTLETHQKLVIKMPNIE